MKLWIIILLLFMFLIGDLSVTDSGVMAQDWLNPEDVSGQVYFAPFPVRIQLDGNFDDWKDIRRVSVVNGPIIPESLEARSSFAFAVAADKSNLYFLIDVVDAHIVTGQHGDNYWNEDSVEIYINGTHDFSLAEYVSGVAQINIPAANIGRTINQTVLYGKDWESVGALAVVVETPTGYGMEVAIPLRNSIWEIDPSSVKEIGFQVQLNSASHQDRDLKLSWSNADAKDESHLNPGVFGRLSFSPIDDAEIAVDTTIPLPSEVFDGVFTVRGTEIYGPNGQVFVAKGTNVNGFNWVWPRRTVDDASLIVDCWGFNLVRVNSFLFMGETKYQQYTTNNDLDEIVRTFTERGVVVVFEGHDRIGSYYQGEDLRTLIAWFTDLARKYRDNPYVWFDVMNEPGGRRSIDVDQWVNMHGQVIQAIRDVADADNIIIVEGAYGGQDAGNDDASPVSDSAILKYGKNVIHYGGRTFNNIVFSIHTYDLWNHGDAKMADYFDRVAAEEYPLIIGEYGIQTDQDTLSAAQSTFNTVIPRNIGRIVWQWDGSDGNDLTENTSTGGGWEIDDCHNPTNLSWLGEQIWEDNHSSSG